MTRGEQASGEGHATRPARPVNPPTVSADTERPAAPGLSWDVVISHVDADAAWARWLCWHLTDAGYRVTPHPYVPAGPPGRPGSAQPRTAGTDVDLAGHLGLGGDLLILWSAAYHGQAAATTAKALPGPDTVPAPPAEPAAGRILLVRVEDCPRPAPYAALLAFDLHGLDATLARDWLLRQITTVAPHPTAALTSPPFPPALSTPPAPAAAAAGVPPAHTTSRTPPATATGPARTLGGAVRLAGLGQDRGHPLSVTFSPNAPLLAVAGTDTTVHLWDLPFPDPPSLGATVAYGRRLNQEWARAVTFSPDGRTLAAAGDAGTTLLWHVGDGQPTPTPLATLTGHRGYLHDLGFSPGGTLLATAGDDRAVLLWDLADRAGPRRAAILAGHRGPVRAVTFSPDGTLLATGSEDHTVILWDLAEPTRPTATATLTTARGPVHTLAFHPDGDLLAVAGKDRAIRIHTVTDPTRPTCVATLADHRRAVHAVTFSPDGQLLAAAGAERTITVRTITDPDQPGPPARLPVGRGGAGDVGFAPDSRLLAVAGAEGITALWDLFPQGPTAADDSADP